MKAVDLTGPFSFDDPWSGDGGNEVKICKAAVPRHIDGHPLDEETRAKALAEASAKADGQLALLRARTQRDIYLLLTPEQRAQISDRRREREAHGPGGPPPP